jgi:protein ImuB
MHPPEASVIALHMQAQPARHPTVQQGLFVPQSPEAGRLEVLLARLRKLLGEDRVGAPELLDSHRPDAFRIAPFVPQTEAVPKAVHNEIGTAALRMLRPPRTVRVEINNSRMTALSLEGKRLPVHRASGPWKTSGAWWTHSDWCREEWDVALGEQEKFYCRLAYDPGGQCWYLTGIYD